MPVPERKIVQICEKWQKKTMAGIQNKKSANSPEELTQSIEISKKIEDQDKIFEKVKKNLLNSVSKRSHKIQKKKRKIVVAMQEIETKKKEIEELQKIVDMENQRLKEEEEKQKEDNRKFKQAVQEQKIVRETLMDKYKEESSSSSSDDE